MPSLLLVLALASRLAFASSCYVTYRQLQYDRLDADGPVLIRADGTAMPIARAFEKEGLFYSDIHHWFDRFDMPAVAEQLRELQKKNDPSLREWLKEYPDSYMRKAAGMTKARWTRMS